MPIVETEGVVLKSHNLAEADRIVVFFTRDHGIIRGVAKGAKRLKSRFGSTLEAFSTVQLTYFEKEERELVSIQNIELLASRFQAASDPSFLRTFSYLAELLIALVPPHDPQLTTYRMVKSCLDSGASDNAGLEAIALYFELWLFRLSGFLPSRSTCGQCGRQWSNGDERWLAPDLHLYCKKCRRERRDTRLENEHVEVLNSVDRLSPDLFLAETRRYTPAVREISKILRPFLRNVVGRDLAMERLAGSAI
ncbi:MAG TPA: DNA repair protein RecO [Pyrinomonadaceae bacterium]|nr:DNA repair protein RecO [Pyrinomonadaceae bacterium]